MYLDLRESSSLAVEKHINGWMVRMDGCGNVDVGWMNW